MDNIQCYRQEGDLYIGHCKVKIIHNEEQQKNVGPLIIERNIAYIAPCDHSLLAVMCQDAIRFRAVYDGKGINYLHHELVPIKEISLIEDQNNNIRVNVKSSKSPDFEIILFNILSDYPADEFDNCVVRSLVTNHQTHFQNQINTYFASNDQYLNALESFKAILNKHNQLPF